MIGDVKKDNVVFLNLFKNNNESMFEFLMPLTITSETLVKNKLNLSDIKLVLVRLLIHASHDLLSFRFVMSFANDLKITITFSLI